MKLINATIQADLSTCSIEEGLLKLKPKSIAKVMLLVSADYSFQDLFNLFYISPEIKNNINTINFPLSNIDTSPILSTDSWMLIDYESQTMYYSEGA